MSTFPLLSTGVVAQYPSSRIQTHSTCITRFVDGSEQRFRELKQPVQSWVIRFTHLSDEEMGAVETFFRDMQGRFGTFTFVDPWDDMEYEECSFDQDTLTVEALEEGRNQGYLVIRNNTP